MYFRLIKLNFPFIKGEGKRRQLSFPSTVDNFRYTFRSPQYSFIASYDAKNELKMIGHRSRFRENQDLPLWRGPAVKKKPPFSNARANHA